MVSTTPNNGAAGVERPPIISVSLSKALLGSSVTAATFKLENSQGQVPCTIYVASNTASLYPLAPMPAYTTYVATLSKNVKDGSGVTLGKDHVWTFTTRGRRWIASDSIGATGEAVLDHEVAINGNGQSVVSWTEGNPGFTYASVHLSTADGWSPSTSLDDEDDNSDFLPQPGIDAEGNTTVIWYDEAGTGRVRSRRFTPTGGWEPVLSIEDSAYTVVADHIHLKTAPDGRLYAVYVATSSNPGAIPPLGVTREYVPGAGWQPRLQGGPVSNYAPDNHDVFMNEAGQMAAVSSGTSFAMRAYNFIGEWDIQDALPLSAAPATPRGHIDDAGNILGVWREGNSLVAALCPAGAQVYVLATFVAEDGGLDPGEIHSLAGDGAGNALLMWQEIVDGVTALRHVRYRGDTSAWATEFPDPVTSGPTTGAVVKMAPNGVAIAAWSEYINNRWVIRSSQYHEGSGWTPSETVASSQILDCFSPRLAVSSDGSATIAFLQGGAVQPFDLRVARYE